MPYETAHLILKISAAAHLGRGGFANQLWHTLNHISYSLNCLRLSFSFPSSFKYLTLLFPAERIKNIITCTVQVGYHKALEIGRMLCAALSLFAVCIDNTSLAAHMHCKIFGDGFLLESK